MPGSATAGWPKKVTYRNVTLITVWIKTFSMAGGGVSHIYGIGPGSQPIASGDPFRQARAAGAWCDKI